MNIYIGNLHPNASEGQIKDLFTQYGKVSSAKIIMDTETGQSRCFGFIEMDDTDDARLAINKLHNQNFMGHYLHIEEAQSKTGQIIKKRGLNKPTSGNRDN